MSWAAHAPEWITIALVLGAVLFARRFGGGAALEQLERANAILERRVKQLEEQNTVQAAELVTLRAQTNVALAIGPVLAALEAHETHAATRSEATLAVLDLIAQRLGPESAAA